MRNPDCPTMQWMRAAFVTAILFASLALVACAVPATEPLAEAPSEAAAATDTPVQAADASPTLAAATATTQLPSTETPAAPTPAQPEEPAPAVDAAELTAIAARVEPAMDAFAAERQFSGVALVARNGEIALAKGYGYADRAAGVPNDTQTRFLIGSITKPITSIIMLMLQEQGLLDVGDPVCQYVDPCPEAWAPISIDQVLAHTAGIPNFTEAPDFQTTKHLPSTVTETIDRFRNRPLDFPPGEHWHYSDSGYILLGHIIETVTGKPYAEVADQLVFGPAGMTNTGYSYEPDNLAEGYIDVSGAKSEYMDLTIPHAAGGLYSTAEDLLKLDIALSDGQLLSRESLNAMFTAQAQIPGTPGSGYGLGWVMVEEFGHPMAFHNGGIEGFVSNITRVMDDGTLVVMLSNEESTVPRAVQETLLRAIYAGE